MLFLFVFVFLKHVYWVLMHFYCDIIMHFKVVLNYGIKSNIELQPLNSIVIANPWELL